MILNLSVYCSLGLCFCKPEGDARFSWSLGQCESGFQSNFEEGLNRYTCTFNGRRFLQFQYLWHVEGYEKATANLHVAPLGLGSMQEGW